MSYETENMVQTGDGYPGPQVWNPRANGGLGKFEPLSGMLGAQSMLGPRMIDYFIGTGPQTNRPVRDSLTGIVFVIKNDGNTDLTFSVSGFSNILLKPGESFDETLLPFTTYSISGGSYRLLIRGF